MKTIVIAKEAWLCSQLSIAKYSGGIDISDEENGKRHFLVVDGKGQPYQGRLSPREPADLVDKEFLPFYRKLGRDKFISIVSMEPLASRKGLKQILSAAVQEKKAEKTAKEEEMKVCQHSLFD
jgi:hypothetical protein|nr:MAG TPA: hypothetical protein [Caudoviricetes sp.]